MMNLETTALDAASSHAVACHAMCYGFIDSQRHACLSLNDVEAKTLELHERGLTMFFLSTVLISPDSSTNVLKYQGRMYACTRPTAKPLLSYLLEYPSSHALMQTMFGSALVENIDEQCVLLYGGIAVTCYA